MALSGTTLRSGGATATLAGFPGTRDAALASRLLDARTRTIGVRRPPSSLCHVVLRAVFFFWHLLRRSLIIRMLIALCAPLERMHSIATQVDRDAIASQVAEKQLRREVDAQYERANGSCCT